MTFDGKTWTVVSNCSAGFTCPDFTPDASTPGGFVDAHGNKIASLHHIPDHIFRQAVTSVHVPVASPGSNPIVLTVNCVPNSG
jgi:hypothetical protein